MTDWIKQYDERERLALSLLPNRLIAACRPVLFDNIGYPTRATSEKELWRWADVMQEGRFERDFANLLDGALSQKEWDDWKAIYSFTKDIVGIVPRGALARAQYVFRAIINRIKPPATIGEIGPGSGYLTVLLAMNGYTVISAEITQAFYLWQRLLFQGVVADQYVPFTSIPQRKRMGAIYHVPWWEFYSIDQTAMREMSIDLVTANHCILEMTQDAILYLGNACKEWNAPLLVDSLGASHPKNWVELTSLSFEELAGTHHCKEPAITLDEIVAYQHQLLGDELRTADERWLDMLYGKDGYY